MQLIANNAKGSSGKQELIKTVQELLKQVESGEVRALACITLTKSHKSLIFQGAYGGYSDYELLGAITHYQQMYLSLYKDEMPNDA